MTILPPDPLPFFVACTIIGATLALLAFRRFEVTNARRTADLIWITVGGLSAATAILSAGYLADFSMVQRRFTELMRHTLEANELLSRFARESCVSGPAFSPIPNPEDRQALCVELAIGYSELYRSEAFERMRQVLDAETSGEAAATPGCEGLFGIWRKDHCDGYLLASTAGETLGSDWGFPAMPSVDDALDNLYQFQGYIRDQYLVLDELRQALSAESEAALDEYREVQQDAYKSWVRFGSLCLLALVFPFRIFKSISDFKSLSTRLGFRDT